MFTIDDFPVSSEIKTIFIEEKIEDESDLIYNLEIYKFLKRKTIIDCLRNKLTKINIESINTVNRNPDFEMIEKKYDILLDVVDSKTIVIIKSVFHEIDMVTLELQLTQYTNLIVKNVTEYNYRLLCNPDYQIEYDYLILFKRILLEVINLGGTDLHFNVKHINMKPYYPVQYRLGTDLLDLDLFKLDGNLNQGIVTKLISVKTVANVIDLSSSDGITSNSTNIFGNNDIELRIAANKVKDGYQCVIRIQQKRTFSFTIDSLGFQKSAEDFLYRISKKRSGITLITGAIRTGKNTTAFALANEMAKQPIKIIDYSSPIEVLMPFNQVDYLDNEKNLLSCVRLAKKQDINVAFINEIPNKEVAFAVKDLANSSIHVITTLHLDRIWHLPYKLQEYYGNSYKDVISQINGVINQKMFDVQCDNCLIDVPVSSLDNKYYREFLEYRNIKVVKVPKGCEKCSNSLHKIGSLPGRNQPYVEYLYFDSEIKSKLLECNYPWEMELVLKDYITRNNSSMEDSILEGIKSSKLGINALDYIL